MVNILVSCINVWNDFDLYRVRNYFFSRLGVFPYHKDDDKRMDQQINAKLTAILGTDSELVSGTLAQIPRKGITEIIDTSPANPQKKRQQQNLLVDQNTYIRSNLNVIQLNIVQLLEPINVKFSYYIIRGFLEIWKSSNSLTRAGINVNIGCEKIIQLLISLQVEPQAVIESVNRWIYNNNYITLKEKKTIDLNAEQKEKATLQSLTCQFVYTYLLQSISNHFKMQNSQLEKLDAEARINYAQDQYVKLYGQILKFIKGFINSRHPNTITWLSEIINILANKFKPDDAKLEKRLKFEYQEVFDQLQRTTASILTDQLNIVYTPQYGINQICFSPTVYEMMKRFEFVKQKAPPEVRQLYQNNWESQSQK